MRNKCLKCMRPEKICLCSDITKIDTNTRFVILIHPMEFKKVKNNTGRLTHLSLPNSEMIMGISFDEDKRVKHYLEHYNCYILYPGEDSYQSSELPTQKDNVIFIIDATWPCSRKILKSSPKLLSLPKISFKVNQGSLYKFKRQPRQEYISTIESTQCLLKELNNSGLEDINPQKIEALLNPFFKMIDIQIDFENNPDLDGYRRRNKKID